MKQWNYGKVMNRMGLAYFLFFALTLILQSVFAVALPGLIAGAETTGWYLWVLSYVPMYLIAFPVFLLVLSKVPTQKVQDKQDTMKLGVKQFLVLLIFCFGTTYLLNFVSTGLSSLFALIKGSDVINPLVAMQQGSSVLMNFIFGCIVAPLGEEYIFRYKMFQKIGAYGEKQYVLLCGFVFALFHANMFQIPYAFALGMLFSYLYCKTRNILVPIAFHVIMNIFGTIVAPLAAADEMLVMVLGAFILICIICAVVLGLRWRKRISYDVGELELPAQPVKKAIVNPGMLLYTILCVALMIFQIIAI